MRAVKRTERLERETGGHDASLLDRSGKYGISSEVTVYIVDRRSRQIPSMSLANKKLDN